MEPSSHATILEKKQLLEEDLRRVEKQIYELEGEYLQETVKDGNILRGWDGYLGKGASSGAIRRINRFREADRMFSASSVTSGQASTFNGQAATKVLTLLNSCAVLCCKCFPHTFLTCIMYTAHLLPRQGAPGASAAGATSGAKVKKAQARKRGRDDGES